MIFLFFFLISDPLSCAGADLVNLDALAVAPVNNRSTSPNKISNNVFAAAPMGNNPFTQVNQNTGNVFSAQVASSNNPFAVATAGPSLRGVSCLVFGHY